MSAAVVLIVAGLAFVGFSFWLFFRLAIRAGLDGDTAYGADPKALAPV